MSNIRNGANQCRNLNHGRMNVPISFCPDCGQRFKPSNSAPCGSQHHADYRKQRFTFCMDCGIKLNK